VSKRAALLLIVILSASSLIVANAAAQSTPAPQPSVPEFTLKYVDNSYDVPPTYGIDQYTGKTVITHFGEHVDNRTIEFTIKNQPFASYVDASGNRISLYYNFRYKGPYGSDWAYYPDTSHTYGYYTGLFPDTSASNSDYTVISIPLNSPDGLPRIPAGAKVEFQVQAIIGYVDMESTGMIAGGFCGFSGERSDWSRTQTITLSTSPASPPSLTSPTPNSTSPASTDQITQPTTNETPQTLQLAAVIGAAIAVVVGAGLLVYFKKHKRS
jgi:hypothetical protein